MKSKIHTAPMRSGKEIQFVRREEGVFQVLVGRVASPTLKRGFKDIRDGQIQDKDSPAWAKLKISQHVKLTHSEIQVNEAGEVLITCERMNDAKVAIASVTFCDFDPAQL
ncbi:MAG: hypothetical protein H7222_18250 [Methylotenera sp.]|nr:hypothetical protein [Oligoflexia bacterium]